MDSIFCKPPNEDVRYRLSMYLFLQIYKLPISNLKRVYTRLEDALVYLSNDTSPFVVEAFHLSLVVLREKDLICYKKCLKVLRPAVEKRNQEVCESLTLRLLELLSVHTRGQIQSSFAAVICPLFPRSATEYLHYLGLPIDSELHPHKSSQPHETLLHGDHHAQQMGPRFGGLHSRGESKGKSSSTEVKKHKKQASGCTVELLDHQLDKYRSHTPNSQIEATESKPKARLSQKKFDSREGSTSPQVIPRQATKLIKKPKLSEVDQKESQDRLTPKLRTPRTEKKFGVVKSEHGRLPSPLMSPPERSFLRSGEAWNQPERRFETFGREEDDQYSTKPGPHSKSATNLRQGFNQEVHQGKPVNRQLLNQELEKLVSYHDHIETYSQRARNRQQLANKTIIMIVEDLILSGRREDLIRFHEYFLHAFHREQDQMTIISNILDECLYYTQFESTEFTANLKIVLLTLNEYLRPPNLLTTLLVFSGELLRDRHVLTHPFLLLLEQVIVITHELHFQSDKHLLIEALSVLTRHQSSWTKQLLQLLERKFGGRSETEFLSALGRFPELEAIHKSAHPPATERLYLLSTIPQLPELSMFKKVQLALSACKGSRPMRDGAASVYRNKKLRDASLLFMTCNRFHTDPFDSQGEWLHDLEDCESLFEGRAMVLFLCAALRKRHLHLSRATCNDWLVSIAEFARRLLFDKASESAAKEILKLCLLAMKVNGIGDYTHLLLPQEVALLAEF